MRFFSTSFSAFDPTSGVFRRVGVKLILHPLKRLRDLQQDHDGQVMVLTAVMVLVVGLISISSLNTSELLYNRIRVQTAADGAADAFAIWQARGFNFNQHVNDNHFEAQLVFYSDTLLLCMSRFMNLGFIGPRYAGACQQLYRQAQCDDCDRDFEDFNLPAVRACCQDINAKLAEIELQQARLSDLLLALQANVNRTFPAMGWLAANKVAEGSGADILDANLQTEIVTTLAELGVPYNINAVTGTILAPSAPLYTVPLRTPLLEMLPLLPIGTGLTALPPWLAGGATGGRCLSPAINQISCMLSTCGKDGAVWCGIIWPLIRGIVPPFIANLIGPSDGCSTCFFSLNITDYVGICAATWCIPSFYSDFCRFPLRDLDDCEYNCTGAFIDQVKTLPGELCGWQDTFFIGTPLAYTWMTAKNPKELGLLGTYRDLSWFNPQFNRPSNFNTMQQDLEFRTSDEYVFDPTTIGRSDDYGNAQFMAMASCSARGNSNPAFQPLTMYSEFLKPNGFGYSRPQMINVFLDPAGVSDVTADEQIIWH